MRIEALFWVSLLICVVSFILFVLQVVGQALSKPRSAEGAGAPSSSRSIRARLLRKSVKLPSPSRKPVRCPHPPSFVHYLASLLSLRVASFASAQSKRVLFDMQESERPSVGVLCLWAVLVFSICKSFG